ncbi:MAG TPA: VWA domain-containing protein [Nocardioides sp.]|uniref:VWA domain-containing protein n=1 Tax=Nocardioides sp. TaxID=35761 RepID=UPI002B7DC03B|nr:VWA domain-containing protein [Nocardioides sp.]HTW18321.1 VWA domain-containing protein [Nocardioides sp.]
MELIQGWVGALILAVGLIVGLAAWWWARPRRAGGAPVLVSSLDRVRALPLFQRLAREEWRRRLLELTCLTAALVGVALMAARLVGVSDDSAEMRTREVVLCLDVSGSMREVDADVIDAYLALADDLDEERIGLVVFDANAVTVFPLTTDHGYVTEQLAATRESIVGAGRRPLPGVTSPRAGSSLIGDGLASCAGSFDQTEALRSRTIVLATDNEVAGDAIYSLQQAAGIARQGDLMVFAIMPEQADADRVDEMRSALAPTLGTVLTISPGESTNVARISSAIKAQQKTALMTQAQERSFDRVTPGAALFVLGLAGALLAAGRRR